MMVRTTAQAHGLEFATLVEGISRGLSFRESVPGPGYPALISAGELRKERGRK